MALPWVWRIRYPTSSGTVITGSVSMRPWTRRLHVAARGRQVVGGARESFSTRTDYIRAFRLRCTEAEYQNLEAAIAWAQANWGTALDFDPGAKLGGTGTYVPCYLVSPAPGEDLSDTAAEAYGFVEVTIELVKASGAAWTEVYF